MCCLVFLYDESGSKSPHDTWQTVVSFFGIQRRCFVKRTPQLASLATATGPSKNRLQVSMPETKRNKQQRSKSLKDVFIERYASTLLPRPLKSKETALPLLAELPVGVCVSTIGECTKGREPQKRWRVTPNKHCTGKSTRLLPMAGS